MLSNNRLNILIKENIHNLLTEISIKDKYQKEKQKLNIPFDTFEMLCNLDPTTTPNKVGKYSNWIIAKYNPNTNYNELKRCLEWYADGLKRGILKRYNITNDINQFKSYDDLIDTMNGLNENDDTDLSQSEYNQRQKLQGQFDILGSNNLYEIIQPHSFDAERYFGSGTAWCTVANMSYYYGYMSKGSLYILYPKNGDNTYKMQFHFETKSFADAEDNVKSNPLKCIESVIQDEQMFDDLRNLCKKVFREYNNEFITFEERLSVIQQRLLNGENPKNIFDWVGGFYDGFAQVELNGKWNFINTNGETLCDQWFDWADYFYNGFAQVELNGKDYYLRKDGVLCDLDTKKPLQESKINKMNKINNINMKQSIKLTESELRNIIKESVNNILSELDWRTADIAHKKAMSKANDNNYNKYQRAKYLRQGRNFEKYRDDKFNTQYNLQGVDGYNNLDTTEDLANSQLTTGQLKQLGKRKNDLNKWISDNTEYRNGQWRKKNVLNSNDTTDYPPFTI